MSTLIKSAHDAAYAAGFRTFWFPPGNYLATSLAQVGNLIFIGPGKLVGTYRKTIIPDNTPQGIIPRFGITAAQRKRWRQALAAASPTAPAVIVLCGDSIIQNGSLPPGDAMQNTWTTFQQALLAWGFTALSMRSRRNGGRKYP